MDLILYLQEADKHGLLVHGLTAQWLTRAYGLVPPSRSSTLHNDLL